MAGVTSDDNARPAQTRTGQAHKRVAADVLIRDDAGRVLLVDPTYKPDWDLPGGMVDANEPPPASCARSWVWPSRWAGCSR